MITISRPSPRHAAYDSILIEQQKSAGDMQESTFVDVNKGGNTISKYTRPFMNGIARFDISGVVRNLFDEKLSNNVGLIPVPSEHLCIQYEARLENRRDTYHAYKTSNQYYKNKITYDGVFLTEFERIKIYDGYPFIVVFAPFEESSTYFANDLNEVEVSNDNKLYVCLSNATKEVRLSNMPKWLNLTNNSNEIITNNYGEVIVVKNPATGYVERCLPVVKKCIAGSPFYVRWLNLSGGYDHWMFEYRQEKKVELVGSETYRKHSFDTSESTIAGLSKSGKIEVKAGSYGLDENEFDNVAKLALSPRIEWYNELLKKWILVDIEKSSNVKDSRLKTQNVEFDFVLPEPKLQY